MPRKRKVDNEEVKFLKDGLPHYEKEIEDLKRELEAANKRNIDLSMALENKDHEIMSLKCQMQEMDMAYSKAIAKLVLDTYGKRNI